MRPNYIYVHYFTGNSFHNVKVIVPSDISDEEAVKEFLQRVSGVAFTAAVDFTYEGGTYEKKEIRCS